MNLRIPEETKNRLRAKISMYVDRNAVPELVKVFNELPPCIPGTYRTDTVGTTITLQREFKNQNPGRLPH